MQSKVTFNYCNEEDKIELFEKIKKIKCHMGEGNPKTITTFELLNRVMDYYILCVYSDNSTTKGTKRDYVQDEEYQLCTEEQALREQLFVCAMSSMSNLVSRVVQHTHKCPASLEMKSGAYLHHGMNLKLTCDQNHNLNWTSSPYIMGGKLLVNMRVLHGIITSGILPGQVTKLTSEAKTGEMGPKFMESLGRQ